jgi:uncharacterized protein (DUF1697 family)
MVSMKYAALLRGIGPTNPNMRNEKLRQVFTELGFNHVQTVITSGNVLFESGIKSRREIERMIEEEIYAKLGFNSPVILRSARQLNRLVKSDPFAGELDTPKSRLNVTFLKRGGQVFSRVDTTSTGTPEIMRQLEKEHGKEITTRTWKTVEKIVKKLAESLPGE